MIKYIDLFAGIGGIRQGLTQALDEYGIQHKCVLSSEIDKFAQETYSKNFAEYPLGDIKKIENLPQHDVLLAGFPCQAFSYAGKRKGFADTRGTLFFEIERLLTNIEKKPRILILENVRGFITHDKGRTFRAVRESLNKLGYGLNIHVLNSSNFGVPQNRVRCYIVGVLGEQPKTEIESDLGAVDSHKFKQKLLQREIFPNGHSLKTVKDILEDSIEEKYICSNEFILQLKSALGNKSYNSLHGVRLIDYRGGNSIHSWDLGIKGECTLVERELMSAIIANRRRKVFGEFQDGKRLNKDQISTFWNKPNLSKLLKSLCVKGYLKAIDGRYNPVCGNMSFEVFKFLDPNSISITVVSSDAHRLGVVQNGVPRRITPRECARLQGFPDTFELHPNDLRSYHQLGNSVSVPVVQAVSEDLIVMGYLGELSVKAKAVVAA